MSSEMVKFDTDSGTVELSGDVVRKTLCDNPQVTDREVELFIRLCKAQHLNPFIGEAHLVKYGDKPATRIVGKDVFTKRAQKNPKFKGMQAGISFSANGKLGRRKGSMLLPGEEILGGWCKVHVEGYAEPMFDEVSFREYAGRKKDGSLNAQWASKPATMIRKVAVVHALREAFPDDFAGLYDEAEMGMERPVAPNPYIDVPNQGECLAASEPSLEVELEEVEDVPDAWAELSEMKQAAVALGTSEEGIASWMAATIRDAEGNPKRRRDYTDGDIALLRAYLQDLLRSHEQLGHDEQPPEAFDDGSPMSDQEWATEPIPF